MRGQEFSFDHPSDRCYLMHPTVTSANVAYDEDYLLKACTDAGFTIEQVLYGKWSGRTADVLDFQDVLVLRKGSYPTP
jgi:hypothetical protein